jgi:ribonuclease R
MARRPRAPESTPAKGGRRAPLPSKAQILEWIRDNPGEVGKREIARAFGVRGDDRVELKRILAELTAEGAVGRGARRRTMRTEGKLPSVAVIEIIGVDVDGELEGAPVRWDDPQPPPRIVVAPTRGSGPAPGLGDRVLARLERVEANEGTDEIEDRPRYEARIIRSLAVDAVQVLGVYSSGGGTGRIEPTDRKAKHDYVVAREDAGGAKDGELVLGELLPGRPLGPRRVRVRERLGHMGDPRTISLIAIHAHGIPTTFPAAALDEAEAARPVELGDRTDLRAIPLVTIDPEDARDHDDAVFAEPDTDPKNPGGWHVVVAIADVAHYVRSGSALDRSARERGNSAYFPDRVVPMLPHELSSDLCSLLPEVDRACLAVHIWLDAEGEKLRHQFVRGLMRSHGNLSYERVQSAIDGQPDEETGALLEPALKPLWAAWRAVMKEREKRQPLDIDSPERKIALDETGRVASVAPRARLDAHRVIEEFMILANVCAAETLEARRQACMYRVHDQPSREKLESLRDFLQTLEMPFAKGQVLRPRHFNSILARAADTPHHRVVNQVVLRSQAQAVYSPDNIGHFGLALQKYAHFTSPIRRYSDLLVHRGLIRGLKLGDDGLTAEEIENFRETAEHISHTERRAMAAERESNDRYLAAFMADRVGATFSGRISGVARFGLFVVLDETGADGIVPVSTLGRDYFVHDERAHALVGERTRETYRLGDAVTVRLREATPVTGGLVFEVLEVESTAPAPEQDDSPRRIGRRAAGGPPRKPKGKLGRKSAGSRGTRGRKR